MHTSQQDTAIVTLTGRTGLGGGSCNFHLLVWENSQCSNYSVFLILAGSPKSCQSAVPLGSPYSLHLAGSPEYCISWLTLFCSSSCFPSIGLQYSVHLTASPQYCISWLTVFCSSDCFPSILYLLAYSILFIWLLPLDTISLGLPYSVHLAVSQYCISWLTLMCSSFWFPSVLSFSRISVHTLRRHSHMSSRCRRLHSANVSDKSQPCNLACQCQCESNN